MVWHFCIVEDMVLWGLLMRWNTGKPWLICKVLWVVDPNPWELVLQHQRGNVETVTFNSYWCIINRQFWNISCEILLQTQALFSLYSDCNTKDYTLLTLVLIKGIWNWPNPINPNVRKSYYAVREINAKIGLSF